jgi:hypothetical protein
MIYLSYINLTPGIKNNFSTQTHKTIFECFKNHNEIFEKFSKFHPEYSLGFTIVTKKDVSDLEIKGPTIMKKTKDIDYSIFLPDRNFNLDEYINLLFEGLGIALKKYDINDNQLLILRDECKRELGIV